MTAVMRFLVFNLLVSLGGGLLAWLIVTAGMRLLNIRSSVLSLCFLSLPVGKSMLLLLGIGLVLPWPTQVFEPWHQLALPLSQVLPILLIWAGAATLIYQVGVRQARKSLLQGARPAAGNAPRLVAQYEKVLEAYRQAPGVQCSDDLCCLVERKGQPSLLVTDRLNSPTAVTSGDPLILFPSGLVSQLNDEELSGALAHELAHFTLRRPNWCSAWTLQNLSLIDPPARLAEDFLHRQEEKACDELAVAWVGGPETYAGMLAKSFRFARGKEKIRLPDRFSSLPRLVGYKPLLSERIEHLLAQPAARPDWRQRPYIIWPTWVLLFSVLFFTFSR